MGIISFLIGASLTAAPLQPSHVQPAPVQPAPVVVQQHPALWVVNDNDTVIYLFGTFHALDGRSNWFQQAVKTAFSASDQLMLETLVPEPPPPVANPHPGAGSSGQSGPVLQLAPSASSLLASTKTVMTAGRAQGMSTDRGADAVLRDAAEQIGKPVGGLESFEFQLNMFNTLQEKAPVKAPDVQQMRALSSVLAQLEAAWNRGDIDSFAALLKQMQAQSPQTYQTMFVERNTRWAHWIANRLKTPGTIFVAVGAGHLSGPDSVQQQLAMLGVKSARVN
jgi:uncharacterized protein YbaP (TraB family)